MIKVSNPTSFPSPFGARKTKKIPGKLEKERERVEKKKTKKKKAIEDERVQSEMVLFSPQTKLWFSMKKVYKQ